MEGETELAISRLLHEQSMHAHAIVTRSILSTAERYAKIEHENRLLLAKMSEIMRKGSLDMVSKSHKYGRSMNRSARKKELQRITQENQKILRRLRTVQPVYSHWKWEEDRIKSEKYLETISEFKPTASRRGASSAMGGRHSSAEGYATGKCIQEVLAKVFFLVCFAHTFSAMCALSSSRLLCRWVRGGHDGGWI